MMGGALRGHAAFQGVLLDPNVGRQPTAITQSFCLKVERQTSQRRGCELPTATTQ